MKIPSNQLEAFYYLAQERNFSRAARRIGLSQPAFSQRIMGLESFLEVTLVIREKQNIQLTDAGERLLRYCKMDLQVENELLADLVSNEENLVGQIRIGGFSSVMRSILIPSMTKMMHDNPALSILTFSTELEDVMGLLRSSKADFVLFNRPIDREGIVSEFLGIEENVLVSHKKYPDLDIYLDHDENDVITSAYFRLLKKPAPKRKRYLDDVYGLVDGIKLGFGKGIIPKHLIDDKNLVIERPSAILKVPVYLIYNEASYYTRLQQEIIQSIKVHFKHRLVQK